MARRKKRKGKKSHFVKVRGSLFLRRGKVVERKSHERRRPLGSDVRIIRGEFYYNTGIWCVSKERARQNAKAFRKAGWKAIVVPRKKKGIEGWTVYLGGRRKGG